ncbi:MAG: malonyl-CoA/methylmalonyl-CoA synthetase [Acidobacteriota bacterium]|jgi:malonyl-CoA/methylmalonyl-CoA synthetase|nr:malonyl-CoA/methylmalonyl-CoA synthetase [Acidobacteriota bacterium]
MNLHDLFAIPLRRSPDRPALRFSAPDGTRTDLTYAELHAESLWLAAGLHARGLRRGDRIAFFLGNRPEFVTAYLAVVRLGAVMVPLNLAYRRREIAHILGDAGPRLLLTERSQLPVLEELDPAERAAEVILAEELETLGGGDVPSEAVDSDDLAMILYTSGTTGRSKGAMITHGNVLATVTGLLAAWAWEPSDVLLLTLPLFHTHGLVVGLHCALAAGATVLLRRRFDAAEAARELLSGQPTLFFGVPTMYVRLVEELRKGGARPDLRLFCCGSAPLSPETFAAFRELTGQDILERYGMTETGMSLSNPYAGPRIPGTVGTPMPGVSARIVDSDGKDVEPGGEGELLVRGSHVFPGYWNDPEKTAASFLHDDLGRRWFRTGDLARRDPATGSYTLLGRSHELILRGGFNIYPREIEEVLASFPGVREAAVVGRPHPEWGEVPVAFLVVDSPLDEAVLISWCREQMAGFKIPHEIRYLDALPRNALGKVQKHLLTE